jgi:hypothetical protein
MNYAPFNLKPLAIFLMLAFIYALTSCEDKDIKPQPVDTDIIELKLEPASLNFQDIWVIATDNEGNVLGSKQWQQGETIINLRAPLLPEQDVNLLFFYSGRQENHQYNSLHAYRHIKPGRQWQIGKIPPYDSTPLSGTCELNILNIPDNYKNKSSMVAEQGSKFLGYTPYWSNNDCNFTLPLYGTTNKAFFSYTPGDADPMYFETDTLQAGNSYTYDFNQTFTPFHNIITVPNPTADFLYAAISGVDADDKKHQQVQYFVNGASSNFKIGYNNGYDRYALYFSARKSNKDYSINVLNDGITPSDFAIPSEDFTILNTNSEHFAFTLDLDKSLQIRSSGWQKVWTQNDEHHNLYLYVYGGDEQGGISIKNFPDEMVNNYPELQTMDDLIYSYSFFIFTDVEQNYNDYLDEVFDEPTLDDFLVSNYGIRK